MIPTDIVVLIAEYMTDIHDLLLLSKECRNRLLQIGNKYIITMRKKYPGIMRFIDGDEYSTTYTSMRQAIASNDFSLVSNVLRYNDKVSLIIPWDLLAYDIGMRYVIDTSDAFGTALMDDWYSLLSPYLSEKGREIYKVFTHGYFSSKVNTWNLNPRDIDTFMVKINWLTNKCYGFSYREYSYKTIAGLISPTSEISRNIVRVERNCCMNCDIRKELIAEYYSAYLYCHDHEYTRLDELYDEAYDALYGGDVILIPSLYPVPPLYFSRELFLMLGRVDLIDEFDLHTKEE